MKRKGRLLVVLVTGSLVFGLVIILVSLLTNRKQWDRETALSVARHDGQALLSRFTESPFEALDYLQMESGPLAPDLRNADEAWVVWKQVFSADSGIPSAIAWYRERLPGEEWIQSGDTPDKATFRKGEWTVVLEAVPGAAPPRFVREVRWTRDPDIL